MLIQQSLPFVYFSETSEGHAPERGELSYMTELYQRMWRFSALERSSAEVYVSRREIHLMSAWPRPALKDLTL